MQFKQSQSFRIFILLLLTVFFTDTVYAAGMMAAEQLPANHTVSAQSHIHEAHDINQHDNHSHDTAHKQSTNDHCSECGHCMACFTVLPPSQIVNVQSQLQAVAISLFKPNYLSYVSVQPKKPPISQIYRWNHFSNWLIACC